MQNTCWQLIVAEITPQSAVTKSLYRVMLYSMTKTSKMPILARALTCSKNFKVSTIKKILKVSILRSKMMEIQTVMI